MRTAFRPAATASLPRPDVRLPGWVLLPLRAFLGVTFVYAGLQKLADRHFFDTHSPSSIQAQLRVYAHHSPARGLLRSAGHHAVLVGLLIAFAELAVGLGALLGLWSRAAAAGGMVLATGFLLSVSWHARPYYVGSDVVFLFAWTPLLLAGDGGVLALDRVLQHRARADVGLAPAGPAVVDFATVRKLCGAYDHGACRFREGAPCEMAPCPVLAATPQPKPAIAAEVDRRTFLAQAGAAAWVAGAALVGGGLTALIGRLMPASHSQRAATVLGGPAPSTSATAPPPTTQTAPPRPTTAPRAARAQHAPAPTVPPRPPGTPIGMASQVPVGGGATFRDPASGDPAWVLQPSAGRFVAFSAVCTHQGCTVRYSRNGTFACPCHGAEFSGSDGSVLQGPARLPLGRISVARGPDGELYVDG